MKVSYKPASLTDGNMAEMEGILEEMRVGEE